MRKIAATAVGALLLVLAAAAARADAGSAKKASAVPPRDSLREWLIAPPFEFSPTRDGEHRRDPFVMPLTKPEIVKDPRTGQPVNPEEYARLLADEKERLRKIEANLAALKACVEKGNGDDVLALYQQVRYELDRPFQSKTHALEADGLAAAFKRMTPRISKALVAAALKDARKKAVEIREAFAAKQYEQTAKLADGFDRLSTIPEAKNAPEWEALCAEVAALARRARARVAFKKRSIRVSSLIVSSRGGTAVINNVACSDGSRLDPNTLVAKVTSDMIVFVYKGEQIEYRFGRF